MVKILKHADMSDKPSTSGIPQLPANVLEAFIPGYSILSKIFLDTLGFDISIIVTVCFLIFGLATALKYAWEWAYSQFMGSFTSTITINSDDDIFYHIMDWLVVEKVTRDSRKLTAKTNRETAWDMLNGDADLFGLDNDILLDFRNWEAKIPPKYQLSVGRHFFFHKGRVFQFDRCEKRVQSDSGGLTTDKEYMCLTCIGRSAQPIKDLIKVTMDYSLTKESSSTVVRRPHPKSDRRSYWNPWMRVAVRPSRPMHTVVLDHAEKTRLLADINEYLHPLTSKWYSNRGIPYRRGYLFHGPPGTGKSSLAWAIAGVFGLNVYCASLADPTLTEDDLSSLFTSLPKRCVVLLEDIDTAGLSKRKTDEDKKKPKEDATPASVVGTEIAKAFKEAKEDDDKGKQGLTLSGLLNVIDGVASHEGRVLIMTTNCPDKLDEALVRPGRIDMRIGFTKATRPQIAELFIKMYSPDIPVAPVSEQQEGFINSNPRLTLEQVCSPASLLTTPEKIKVISTDFASRLPEDTFTPAEIQGFLLTMKKEPEKALEEVEGWKEKTLEERRKREEAKTGEKADKESKWATWFGTAI